MPVCSVMGCQYNNESVNVKVELVVVLVVLIETTGGLVEANVVNYPMACIKRTS